MTEQEYLQAIKGDEENPQPSYFTILTAEVRYSEAISDFEKILFSEIVLLTKAKGFCFASNNYFAKVFNKDKTQISKYIANLKKAGFIDIEMIYKENTQEVVGRVIRIKLPSLNDSQDVENSENNDDVKAYSEELETTPIVKNDNTPIVKNDNQNNINILNKYNIITSELDNLVNHDAVDYKNLNSQKNNFENQDINQSDFQADDKAILSASDNLKPHAHSSPESPLTEGPPAADSQLQKIRQAEKQELIDFKNELLKSYSRLMGRMPSELKQTEMLKTEKARAELKAIFKNRKYDWRECIEYAERKVERHDFDFRWYNFLKTLKRILEVGVEDDTIPVHYSAEKRYFNDLERQKKHEAELKRWEAEAYAEEKKRADEQGITVEELKRQEAEKMKNFEEDFIKQMKAYALA